MPFPFGAAGIRYFYLARNGVFGLAQHFGLDGREVLFPSYFHGVELEALLAAGVRPRFYPVHAGMRVDPDEVACQVGPETRAIYLIHYAGFPGPVEALSELCRERGLLLIEDCALALLSRVGTKPLGSFGDASVFCLYKWLPTIHGGAVVLRDGGRIELASARQPGAVATALSVAGALLRTLEVRGGPLARRLGQSARARVAALKRSAGVERVAVGSNHFDPTHADLLASPVMGSVLERQDYSKIVQARRRNFLHLASEIGDLTQPIFSELPEGVCPLFYPLTTPRKKCVWARLRDEGVECVDFWSVGHPALPNGAFPESDALRRDVLELPCHQDLSPAAIQRLATTARRVILETR